MNSDGTKKHLFTWGSFEDRSISSCASCWVSRQRGSQTSSPSSHWARWQSSITETSQVMLNLFLGLSPYFVSTEIFTAEQGIRQSGKQGSVSKNRLIPRTSLIRKLVSSPMVLETNTIALGNKNKERNQRWISQRKIT